jgi:hypothetical protein
VASVILEGVTKAMSRYNAEAPPAAR